MAFYFHGQHRTHKGSCTTRRLGSAGIPRAGNSCWVGWHSCRPSSKAWGSSPLQKAASPLLSQDVCIEVEHMVGTQWCYETAGIPLYTHSVGAARSIAELDERL